MMTSHNEPGTPNGSHEGHHGHATDGAAETASLLALNKAEGKLHDAEMVLENALHEVKSAEHAVEEAEVAIEEAHPHHHVIHFTVDGEDDETERLEWTPNEIISQFGEKDPASHYLVEIDGHHKKNFQGKGDEKFELHEGARFQIICTGPTPVSDGTSRTGVEHFIVGLQTTGFEPTQLPDRPDHIMFDYIVETGKFAGRKVRLGLIVPADFPLTPPSGPHVSPSIHPINASGSHPTGHVHATQSQPFRDGTGQDWQYWSRPHPNWSKRSVAAYMSHIWHLWDSQ